MTDVNKVALVTGGSRGIGKACALELAKAGYDVVINYAGNEEAANKTVDEIKALGQKAAAKKFDVSNKEAAEAAIAEIVNEFGRIDVLVNNAGITRDNLFMRMKDEEWLAVINTNLNSAYFVTNPVSKIMIKQRSGAIVNMASVSGVYGNAGQANYSAAKAGMIGFTKALAKELASRNIRVNAVAPGFIQTDMTKDLPVDKIVERIPLKTLGQPEDIAKTVKFLAADATYITGQVIGVDGGLVI
ncbi:MAG: 3-oxoacyl-[acyl-carrier-protein] reductase [Candidatus Gastranaerophilales bacterium]|nr:3-oxoacyl-[acyl-carrier-protein] reductase [Candidatus Gastranaerophilales bacterium]